MLKLRKQFIGLALAATLFAGCQTASKNTANVNDGMTDEQIAAAFPGYGSDRSPAGLGGDFEKLLEKLTGVTIRKTVNAADRSATKEFVNFVNRTKSEEIKALKDAKYAAAEEKWKAAGSKAGDRPQRGVADRLDETDIKGVSPDSQSRIAKAFLDQSAIKDLPALNDIRKDVDAHVALLQNPKAGSAKMTAAEKAELITVQTGNTRNVHQMIEKNTQYAALAKAFDDMGKVDPWFVSADGKKYLNSVRIEAGKIYQLTGRSHLTPGTCQNLTKDAMEQYKTLLSDIRKDFEKYPTDEKGMVRCRNIDEITAWVAAKFQERLGRKGISALTAVEEMSICDYVHPKTSPAAQRMMASTHGELGSEPGCI